MTPPDTREQARATAERLLSYGQHAYVRPENVDQRDRLTDYILARDAAHAAEAERLGREAETLRNALDDHPHIAAMGNAQMYNTIKRLSVECDGASQTNNMLRSRLSTVERERDEARERECRMNIAVIAETLGCPGESLQGIDEFVQRLKTREASARTLLERLTNGVLWGRDEYAHALDEARAYLSRSPVEGGRGMVTPSVPAAESTSAASLGESCGKMYYHRTHFGPCKSGDRCKRRPCRLESGHKGECGQPRKPAALPLPTPQDGQPGRPDSEVAATPETRDMKTREGT